MKPFPNPNCRSCRRRSMISSRPAPASRRWPEPKDWMRYSEKATRETNTMPQWAGSCWYYLRFCDPHNGERFVGEEAERYWMGVAIRACQAPRSECNAADGASRKAADTTAATPGGVDLYVGGTEHAVLHLLYARFWHKVLFDLGHLSTPEPFQRLVNQGHDPRRRRPQNVEALGQCDRSARCHRRIRRRRVPLLRDVHGAARADEALEHDRCGGRLAFPRACLAPDDGGKPGGRMDPLHRRRRDASRLDAQQKVIHATIKKVGEDIEALSFNTAIAQMMIFVNAFTTEEARPVSALRTLLLLLNPFAPHLTSELWETLAKEIPARAGRDHQSILALVTIRIFSSRTKSKSPCK